MSRQRILRLPARSWLDRVAVDYLVTVDEDLVGDIKIEDVARAVGVSRATAYRHFQDHDGLLLRGAVELAYRYAETLFARIAYLPTVPAKIEETLAYSAASRADKGVRSLLVAPKRPDDIRRAMNQISAKIMAPIYRAGQLDGQIRDDLAVEEIIIWLGEQRRILMGMDSDEAAVRLWVRRFVLPAVRPPYVVGANPAEVRAAFGDLDARLGVIQGVLDKTRSIVS